MVGKQSRKRYICNPGEAHTTQTWKDLGRSQLKCRTGLWPMLLPEDNEVGRYFKSTRMGDKESFLLLNGKVSH